MRKLRGLTALLVALILAGLASYNVYTRLQRPRPSKPVSAHSTAKVETAPKQEVPPPPFSQQIEPGFRAFSLTLDMSAGGELHTIHSGDRVDILAVTKGTISEDSRLSRLLLSGIPVLEVNKDAVTGGRNKMQVVTLKVTPQQAAKLAAADPAATLRLVLRNREDQTPLDQSPTAFTPENGIGVYLPQQRDLERMVTPGMRAMTLEVTGTDGVAGIFRPDDRVDILVTCPWGNVNLSEENEPGGKGTLKETHRNAKIYFQNIKILTTDQNLRWDTERNMAVGKVTLEVTPRQAEELTVLADSKQGKSVLRLISRNRNDRELAQTEGVELLDLLGGRVPYTKVRIYRGSSVNDKVFYRGQ